MNLTESYIKRLQELAGIVSEAVSIEQLKSQFVDSGKMTLEDFEKILSITDKKVFVNWLVKKVYDKIISLDELDLFKKYLDVFDRRKSDYQKQDISQYKTIDDVKKFKEESENFIEEEAKDPSKQKGLTKEDKYADLKIGIVDGFDVYMLPKGREDLYGASCDLGTGTGWCTATRKGRESFDRYISDGPLFIFIKPNSDLKYQISVENKEFKDNKNKNVYESDKISFYEFLEKKFPEYNLSNLPSYFITHLIKLSLNDKKIKKFLDDLFDKYPDAFKYRLISISELLRDKLTDEQIIYIIENYHKKMQISIDDKDYNLLETLSPDILYFYFKRKLENDSYSYLSHYDFKYLPTSLYEKVNLKNFETKLSPSNIEQFIASVGYDKIKSIINNNNNSKEIFINVLSSVFKNLSPALIIFYINLFKDVLNKEMAIYAYVNSGYNDLVKSVLIDISPEYDFDKIQLIKERFEIKGIVDYLYSVNFDYNIINKNGIDLTIEENLFESNNDFNLYYYLTKKLENDKDNKQKFSLFINLFKNIFSEKKYKILNNLVLHFRENFEFLDIIIKNFKTEIENINYIDLFSLLYFLGLIKENKNLTKYTNYIYSIAPKESIKQAFERFSERLKEYNLTKPDFIE